MRTGDILANRYQLEENLDAAATAEVWSAFDLFHYARVAIKILYTGHVDRWQQARFYRDVYTAGRVKHPNLVDVLAVTQVEGRPAVVMELLRGESLRARLDRTGPLEVHEAAHVLGGVVAGVSAVHAQAIAHRELKPSKIFLAYGDDSVAPKVLDFGLTRLTPRSLDNVSLRTLHYKSPEQLREQDPDERSDVWSLGVILYECLTGEAPTAAPTWPTTIMRILGGIPPIRRVRPDLPRGLASLLGRMLELDPQARASLDEVDRELSMYTRRHSGFMEPIEPQADSA